MKQGVPHKDEVYKMVLKTLMSSHKYGPKKKSQVPL